MSVKLPALKYELATQRGETPVAASTICRYMSISAKRSQFLLPIFYLNILNYQNISQYCPQPISLYPTIIPHTQSLSIYKFLRVQHALSELLYKTNSVYSMFLLTLTKKLSQSPLSARTLHGIISPHIIKILDQDQLESTHRYTQCFNYMIQVSQKCNQNQARVKCNLLFNAHSVCDSLSHLKNLLSQLILREDIKTQYELDQLIKWLTKEIKINKDVGQPEIRLKLQSQNKDHLSFEKEIQQLEKQQPKCSVSQLCKIYREKFPNIDSKVIYQRINKNFKTLSTQNLPKKQNKLWDKLLQIRPRQLKLQCNSKEIYQQHLKITGGKPRFRFPPEPNGYLHIGHVKSIRVNFQSALRTGGTCYLRYDDTNPDKESHQFIRQIEENVRWLGYNPDKITFASDYFEQLEMFALQLIKAGHAYICESSQEEIQIQRKNKTPNLYRDRKIEQNLKIFPNLAPNQTLRLKGIYDSPNPTLRDPILYRLKEKPHPRTGNRFKIYPMYDFTHGICDSLENIDYSLCSLQFEVRRQLYYTFLDLLGLYKPVVWEYSRLNIEGNVLSKRKIKDFIDRKVVSGWDDPRLLTIRGLRNRGYTPQMLKQFIDKVNCSRSSNQNIVQSSLLQKEMKKVLLAQSYKTMGVLQPFVINVIGWQPNQVERSAKKIQPNLSPQSSIYIQQADASKLQNDEIVILKYIGAFQYTNSDSSHNLTRYSDQDIPTLKKHNPNIKILHWINPSQSIQLKTVLYSKLLNPQGELNPHSKTEYLQARIPKNLLSIDTHYIQLQKIGFFKFSNNKEQLNLCTLL